VNKYTIIERKNANKNLKITTIFKDRSQKGASRNLASVRLVGIFSPIKAISRRNTSVFQGKLTQSGGKSAAKMMGGRLLEVP